MAADACLKAQDAWSKAQTEHYANPNEIQAHDPNWSPERDIFDYLTISCGLRISEARQIIAEAQARLMAALLARDTEETSELADVVWRLRACAENAA
jgi:hypothetical protein